MSVVETVGRAFLGLHQSIYDKTDGRVGHRMLVVPCLLLRTTGRRSGKPRTAALVYASDGRDYVVVGSNGGSDRPPGWIHNVRAQPNVEVQVGRRHMPATARVLEQGDPDYERLWRVVNDNNRHRYDSYQTKTNRPIPLVVLTPN
jgi:deazaflavin-dependent oxidoreductase (nitroreductase family)